MTKCHGVPKSLPVNPVTALQFQHGRPRYAYNSTIISYSYLHIGRKYKKRNRFFWCPGRRRVSVYSCTPASWTLVWVYRLTAGHSRSPISREVLSCPHVSLQDIACYCGAPDEQDWHYGACVNDTISKPDVNEDDSQTQPHPVVSVCRLSHMPAQPAARATTHWPSTSLPYIWIGLYLFLPCNLEIIFGQYRIPFALPPWTLRSTDTKDTSH